MARAKHSLVSLALALLGGGSALLGLVGCEESTRRNEALLLMTRVDAIALQGPVAERQRQLQLLKTLRFQTPEVREAQRTCVGYHEALLRTEARVAADRAEVARHDRAHKRLSADLVRRLRRNEARFAQDTRQVRRLFPRCQHAVRRLRLRYNTGRRRRR